jgi:hypothetical protein
MNANKTPTLTDTQIDVIVEQMRNKGFQVWRGAWLVDIHQPLRDYDWYYEERWAKLGALWSRVAYSNSDEYCDDTPVAIDAMSVEETLADDETPAQREPMWRRTDKTRSTRHDKRRPKGAARIAAFLNCDEGD